MKHEIGISWKEDMAFEAEVNGHKIMLDADEKVGGKNLGPRPKPFMLTALAGCTAMDVISILKKMRVTPDNFDVKVSGEVGEEYPKPYTSMHITYQFWGEDLPMEKLEKAVNLSQDRYCGVSAIYKKALPITSSIEVNPERK